MSTEQVLANIRPSLPVLTILLTMALLVKESASSGTVRVDTGFSHDVIDVTTVTGKVASTIGHWTCYRNLMKHKIVMVLLTFDSNIAV